MPHLSPTRRPLRSRRRNPQAWLLAWLLLGLLFAPPSLRADEASGTYTGTISLRGNYYWERSTRVLAPATVMSLETPSGVRAEAGYLIDAITSASQATGIMVDREFTETRHDATAGIGYEFDFGKSQLDLSARGRFSREPDYLSLGAGFGAALSMNQRMSVISLNGYFVHDDVGSVVRMAAAAGESRVIAKRREHRGNLDVGSLGIAWDQVLNATTTMTLGVDVALLEGFQANPYRVVAYQQLGVGPENHPERRLRQGYYTWFSHYLKKTHSALRLGYRLYRDSWDILAHVPEVRLHQELGEHAEVRLRYRYYTQSAAYFQRSEGYSKNDRYITNDPKMTAFRDQTLGVRLRLDLGFLAFTPLDFFHTAVLDFGVEYIFNTNRYGNGLVGQGGMSWAF